MSGYVNFPFNFAGTEPMTLTLERYHAIERWKERVNHTVSGPLECTQEIAKLLENKSLITIYERVPIYGTVALYLEAERLFLFLSMGTRASRNQIRISTMIYRENDTRRIMVNPSDYCYILHENGILRFGKNKKYFEYKTLQTGYASHSA